MIICLERGANDLHMVQLMPLPPHHLLLHIGSTFLVPAYPGCPAKEAVKWVSGLVVCSTPAAPGHQNEPLGHMEDICLYWPEPLPLNYHNRQRQSISIY